MEVSFFCELAQQGKNANLQQMAPQCIQKMFNLNKQLFTCALVKQKCAQLDIFYFKLRTMHFVKMKRSISI